MGQTGLEKAKTVLRVTSGNFLEMYDFFLFGIYALRLRRPSSRATTLTLRSWRLS